MDLSPLKRINLPEFLCRRYGIQVSNGKAHCPFHPPDEKPSFAVFQGEAGAWLWKDHHESDVGGSIIDFVSRKDGLSIAESIQKIKELEGLEDCPTSTRQATREIAAVYDYVDEAGNLIFQKVRYIPKSFSCRRPVGASWEYNTRGIKVVPYRLNRIKDEARVFICEGEKDADLLAGLGYPSTSAPFGAGSWPAELNPYFRGKSVFILYDVGNETKVQRIASELSKFTNDVIILYIPLDQREADISDFLSPFTALDDKRAKMEEVIFNGLKYEPPKPKTPETAFRVTLAERGAESIRIRAIPWLWHGVMPTHMATAITGDAGQGKSLVAVDMAARVSRGMVFPVYDKSISTVRGQVFYITSEGVPDMILVPRLMAAGADLSKVTIVEGIYQRKDHFSMFDITRNLPEIERRAKDFPDLKLIIIDPIASFLPERINTNQGNQVRLAMDRISELAYKLGIAIPTVMHFAKTPGVKAIHRTSGSVQFEAAVKMSWSVIRREEDPRNARVLVPQKSNITGGYKSLSFSIQQVEFPASDNPAEIITTAKIIYGDHIDEDPETLISPPIEKDGDMARAVEFLRRKMTGGVTLYASDVLDEAENEGIPEWSVKKARVKLGLKADKEDKYQGRWFWCKPQDKT